MPEGKKASFRCALFPCVSGRRRVLLAGAVRRGAAAGLLLAACTVPSAAAEGVACPDAGVERGSVASVSPSGDLVLSDGTVLRLAGLAGGGAGAEVGWRPGLAQRVAGREILFAAGPARDRYGRRAALVRETPMDGAAITLQQALLTEGWALARPEEGFLGCLPSWLEAETEARHARRGLWRRLPLDARQVDAIRAQQGRFTIIAGRVLDVGKSSRVDYLNFGRVWRQDMTGRLERPARIALEAQGIAPEDLAGRQMRLRGTVFESGGPAIAIRRVEQIDWRIDQPPDRQAGREEARGRTRPTGDE